jgi:hypothetical protein
MCFSAGASFTSGVVLTVIGIACLKKSQHPSQQLFASIPLFFGIQQFTEGILWITIPDPDHLIAEKIFTYLFLIFAQILWPFWIPLSVLMLEKNERRKKIHKALLAAGIMVSIYMAYCLLSYNVKAKIEGHHIRYVQDYPSIFRGYGTVLYVLATIAPAFFSTIRRIWIFGTAIVISYGVSAIFYEHYVLSVWCFFLAIISMSIYLIMRDIIVY